MDLLPVVNVARSGVALGDSVTMPGLLLSHISEIDVLCSFIWIILRRFVCQPFCNFFFSAFLSQREEEDNGYRSVRQDYI